MFYECMERLFQMGELTGQLAVEMFCSWVAHNPVLHAHYLCTYTEEDAKHVSLLHEDVHRIAFHWIACMFIGRTAPSHTKEHTRERRSSPLWYWRQSQITTYGFRMLHLVSWVVAMTSIFLISVHSTNSSWMVHTPKLISNLLLMNEYSTSYFIWWMEYTHN